MNFASFNTLMGSINENLILFYVQKRRNSKSIMHIDFLDVSFKTNKKSIYF
jgi:hypothetical protein